MTHVATVQSIYQFFGTGNIPAILELIAEDAEWEHDGKDHGIPYVKPGRGRAHVISFFETVGRDLAFTTFDVLNVMGNGDMVVAIVRVAGTFKPTGKSLADYEAHVWTFNARGQVSRFKHLIDTHAHIEATRG
jgi:uncharacterized protein